LLSADSEQRSRGHSAYVLFNHVSVWQDALRFEALWQRGGAAQAPG